MAKQKSDEISILEVTQGRIEFCVLGKSPLIVNRMSEKAKRELLLPKGRKTASDKASTLKHDPLEEFRASAYIDPDEDADTLLTLPATAFKGAMGTAALDMPGSSKSQIGRLVYVEGDIVHIYGTPQIYSSITRSKGIDRTPDVRTRAILPQWGCRIAIQFVRPIIRDQSVANLLAGAGITAGVGDFRPEKGKGNYGQFELVSPTDKRFKAIEKQGRAAQKAALDSPQAYDLETEGLLSWFEVEVQRRGFKVVS